MKWKTPALMILVSSVAYGIFYAYSNYQTTTKDCLPFHAKKNYQEFVRCLEDGANLGNLRNQVTLAHLYMTGEAVPANHVESIMWARKAAERDEPNAQNLLGSAYETGKGVEKSYQAAFEWYQKAANQGLPLAQFNLAILYINGTGTEKNYDKALGLLEQAAKAGDANAREALKQAGIETKPGK